MRRLLAGAAAIGVAVTIAACGGTATEPVDEASETAPVVIDDPEPSTAEIREWVDEATAEAESAWEVHGTAVGMIRDLPGLGWVEEEDLTDAFDSICDGVKVLGKDELIHGLVEDNPSKEQARESAYYVVAAVNTQCPEQSAFMAELESRDVLIDCEDKDPDACERFRVMSGFFAGSTWVMTRASELSDDPDWVDQKHFDTALGEFLPMLDIFKDQSESELAVLASNTCDIFSESTADPLEVARELMPEYGWQPEEAGFFIGTTTAARCLDVMERINSN